jgi:hypothetical protein
VAMLNVFIRRARRLTVLLLGALLHWTALSFAASQVWVREHSHPMNAIHHIRTKLARR